MKPGAAAVSTTLRGGPTHLPPGPSGLSFVWELLRSPTAWIDFLERCARDYGDIAFFKFLTIPTCFVKNPAGIEEVLVTNSKNFTKSQDYRALQRLLGDGLLTSEGELWKHQRKLVQPAFHRERIEAYSAIMTEYTARAIDHWNADAVMNIHAEMMRLTLAIASRCLFDADIADEASTVGRAITEVMEDFLSIANLGFLLPDWVPFPSTRRFGRALKALDAIVYELIRERRDAAKPSTDLLGMLLEARDEDGRPMSDKQLRDEVMTLLLAGHETTANALTWALYLLAKHPEIQEKAGKQLSAEMVIKEALRLYPPAWAIGRRAIEPFDLLGYRFPAGTNVFISQWIVQRDAKFFPEPERFDPERWSASGNGHVPRFAYFPFGAGPRVCVGAAFAMMEATQALAMLIEGFRFSLTAETRAEPLPSITLRPKYGMQLRVERR